MQVTITLHFLTPSVYRMKRSFEAMDIDTGARIVKSGVKGRRFKRRRLTRPIRGALTPIQRNQVVRLINRRTELKYFVANSAASQINSTASVTGVPFDISVGTGDSARIGDSIMWCGTIEINLQIVCAQGATGDTYNNLRFMVLQWHGESRATPFPTVADILINGPTGAADIYSTYNHDNRYQITVLYDKVFRVVGNGNTATNPPMANVTTGVVPIRIPTKRARKHVQYVGGGLQGTNRLFILTVSDSALATHPTLAYTCKSFFRDA